MVMEYANNGNLRKNLQYIIKQTWTFKLDALNSIINGIKTIHQQKLIHRDLHDGNILIDYDFSESYVVSISDLGLCKPVEDFQFLKKNSIYGVIPFIAPEVLRGKPYTPASDIYSFSMIMWEFTSGVPPFNDRAHDYKLTLSICRGERPRIIENTPQCYIDLMKKCWNEDPLKRPDALEISNIIENWYNAFDYDDGKLKSIVMEFQKADKDLEQGNISTVFNNKPVSESHPQAYYTSRLLDFTKHVNEILNQKEKEIFDYEVDQSDEIHKTGLSQIINEISFS